jgi:RNA polymerase sigma factor (sigma-70 family)
MAMDDRDVVAAIATGDPTGIAVAYDRYAAGLYGYCHWMLHEQAEADEALRDTFVVAATLGDLPQAPKLRPWLYAVARKECLRRLRTTQAVPGEQADAADHPSNAADHAVPPLGQSANGADKPTEVTDPEQAELQRLIRATLAELKPDEREVIELSLGHDLYDTDLAATLGVSWNQARTLTSRARSQLEEGLGTLLIARTGRENCAALGALLADWDGELTEQTRNLVAEHTERCKICAGHRRVALRPAVLSGLQPLAELSPALRDDVLRLCTPTAPETPMYRRSAESVRSESFSEAIRTKRLGSFRNYPGAAIAALAVILWVAAAVIVTLLTLAGSHSARAAAVPSVSAPGNSPAAAIIPPTNPATSRTAAAGQPSPTGADPSAYPVPALGPSAPSTVGAGPPLSASSPPPASSSSSPSPSKSPSPSPSPSKSSSPSPSPSKSPSPTPSPDGSPSPSPSKSK